MVVETRYFDGGEVRTANGRQAQKLDIANDTSFLSGDMFTHGGNVTASGCQIGIRVFKVAAGDVETEIISAGSPVAVASGGASLGVAEIDAVLDLGGVVDLDVGDAILVKMYARFNHVGEAWQEVIVVLSGFISEVLGADFFDDVDWTCHYLYDLWFDGVNTFLDVFCDPDAGGGLKSAISNFTYTLGATGKSRLVDRVKVF